LTKAKQIVLFTSQSGIDIGNALAQLNTNTGRKAEVFRAEGEKIGDVIRTFPISKDLLDNINSRYAKSVGAIKSCEKDIAFVSVHCTFRTQSAFHSSIEEFLKMLTEAKIQVKGIVTLIDDFYSTYFRIREYYRQRSIQETMNPLDVLYWRNIDLMLAHMLANQLGIRHYTISVNHPLSLLTKLLFQKHTTIYAGHPISDIRRKGDAEQQALMSRVNQEHLIPLSHHPGAVTFIPDTTDEFPIIGIPGTSMANPPATIQELRQRIWPKDWLNSDPPIASPVPDDVAGRYFDELLTKIRSNSTLFQEAVLGQISDRDYRLVNQSTNFVFSLFREIPTSLGVEQELVQTRRYADKNAYFFNPDSLQPGGGGSRPNWATHVTGENSSIDEIIRVLPQNSDPSLFG